MRRFILLLAIAALAALLILAFTGRTGAEADGFTARDAPTNVARAPGDAKLQQPEAELITTPIAHDREEIAGPDAAAPLEPAERSAVPVDALSTSITVRWRGGDVRDRTAILVRGHGAFMDGASKGREEKRIAMEPTEPQVAEAVFRGVPNSAWSVGVEDSVGGVRWAAASVSKESPETTVEFAAGTTTLNGTVWNEAGRPVEGARIYVQCRRPQGTTISAGAMTGEDGRYEIRGLYGGAGWFSATDASREVEDELANHVLSIPSDEIFTVDVGSPVGSATVVVQVVDVAGESLSSGTVSALAKGRSETADGKLGDDGKVELSLPPGTWMLLFWGGNENFGVLDEFEVLGRGTVERRLVLPGARALGKLEWTGAAPNAAVVAGLRIALRSEAGSAGTIVGRAQAEAEGRFRFDGVAPGTYWLTTYPIEAASEVTLTVLEGETTQYVTIPMSE